MSFPLRPTLFSVALHWFFLPWSIYLGPPKIQRWLLNIYPSLGVQKLKNIVDILWDKSLTIMAQRKAAMEAGDDAVNQHVGGGKDIMSILRKSNEWCCVVTAEWTITVREDIKASEEDRLPYDQLVAQIK